jgi:hypothetical protein
MVTMPATHGLLCVITLHKAAMMSSELFSIKVMSM